MPISKRTSNVRPFRIELHRCDPQSPAHDRLLDRYRSILSVEECRAADAIGGAGRYRAYLVGHALLRDMLSSLSKKHGYLAPSAWHFMRDERGKPRLAPSDNGWRATFNLSYARRRLVCAVADAPCRLGVDIAALSDGRALQSVEKRLLSSREGALLGKEPPGARAARLSALWAQKEAYSKAVGQGLRLDFRTIDCPWPGDLGGVHVAAAERDGWRFYLDRSDAASVTALVLYAKPASLTIRERRTIDLDTRKNPMI